MAADLTEMAEGRQPADVPLVASCLATDRSIRAGGCALSVHSRRTAVVGGWSLTLRPAPKGPGARLNCQRR
jgi:hypothetical protein